MKKYRIHYETYVDVVAESEDEAVARASESDYDQDVLENIQVLGVEELDTDQ